MSDVANQSAGRYTGKMRWLAVLVPRGDVIHEGGSVGDEQEGGGLHRELASFLGQTDMIYRPQTGMVVQAVAWLE